LIINFTSIICIDLICINSSITRTDRGQRNAPCRNHNVEQV